jgi:hypothetical protein
VVDYFNSIVARVAASRRLVKFQRPCMAVRRRGSGIARNDIYELARRGKALRALAIRGEAEYQTRASRSIADMRGFYYPDPNQTPLYLQI